MGYSTTQALIEILDKIRDSICKGKIVCGIFADIYNSLRKNKSLWS